MNASEEQRPAPHTRLTGLSAPTRKDAALMYADAIAQERNGQITVDWVAVNARITERWSLAGLQYIKQRAWKVLEAAHA